MQASARPSTSVLTHRASRLRPATWPLQVATFEDRKWIPRLEILAKTLHLRTFEKHVLVLLVREYLMSRYLGSASSGLGEQTDRVNFYRSLSPRCSTTRRFDIKTLCAYFSVTFTEQLQVGGLVVGWLVGR